MFIYVQTSKVPSKVISTNFDSTLILVHCSLYCSSGLIATTRKALFVWVRWYLSMTFKCSIEVVHYRNEIQRVPEAENILLLVVKEEVIYVSRVLVWNQASDTSYMYIEQHVLRGRQGLDVIAKSLMRYGSTGIFPGLISCLYTYMYMDSRNFKQC